MAVREAQDLQMVARSGQGAEQYARQTWSGRDWRLALLLVAAIFIAYQQVWQAGFIWDDEAHLTANPCIIGPLGLKEIWTTAAARICPLVLSTFWLEHKIWGLNPLPYHLVNVLLLGASAIVLWRVLRSLRAPGAWLGAALWALHPVQVESVAWITELKNTQSGLFYLLSVLFFVKWKASETGTGQRKAGWSYPLACLFGVLAMASKSSTVILPLVLGLVAWWMEGRWKWREAWRLAPFCLMSVLAGALSMWTQKLEGAQDPHFARNWAERIAVAGRVIWFYLGKLVWPHPLIFIYPRWQIDASHALSFVPVLLVGVALGVLWWKRRGAARPVFVAFVYFIMALLPVLGLMDHYFLRYSFVGDHFQYLASMGPLALAAAGFATIFDSLRRKAPWLPPVFCAALLAVLGFLTWKQCGMYADVETLWRMTSARNPGLWMAHQNLGTALLQQGRSEEAIAQFGEAMRIDPANATAHYNFGNVLFQQGRTEEAIAHYREAARLNPANADAHNNLGVALFQQGKTGEAIAHYREAVRLNPAYADAHNNLGNALLQQGRTEEAIAHYLEVVRINPAYAAAHYNLGNALLQQGQMGDAIEHLQKALELLPGNVAIQNNLAWVLATAPQASLRNGARAVQLAAQASQSSGGNNPIILHTLAAAYAEAGQFSSAVQTAQKALQLAEAQSNANLATALRREMKLYEAGHRFEDVR